MRVWPFYLSHKGVSYPPRPWKIFSQFFRRENSDICRHFSNFFSLPFFPFSFSLSLSVPPHFLYFPVFPSVRVVLGIPTFTPLTFGRAAGGSECWGRSVLTGCMGVRLEIDKTSKQDLHTSFRWCVLLKLI